ncbi:MAG: tetratricopeptide repeat protein [Actinomycetes bacterium]
MSAEPAASPHVVDVTTADFETAVLARSHDVPVVVDFWAAWCGPCRTLGPTLEAAVDDRGGEVVLAKVDVDAEPALAQRYRVQGIPAVKAFRDGQVVAEFTGALGRTQVDQFLDQVVPTAAERAASRARGLRDTDREQAVAAYREALALEPDHRAAAVGLAELLIDTDPDEALALVHPHRPDPAAEAVVTRAELARAGGGADLDGLRAAAAADPDDGAAQLALGRALAGVGEHDAAVDALLAAVRAGGDAREPAREQLVALFNVLGDEHEVVRRARPLLARALF